MTIALLGRLGFGLSLFVTFLLLWLGLTVLASPARHTRVRFAAGAALLLGAAFFLSHAMIVGKGPTTTGSGMEFWWRIGWLPAVLAPLSWYATVLRYAGLPPGARAVHRRLWLVLATLGLGVLVLLVVDNPFASYGALLTGAPGAAARPLIWLFLALALACTALPLAALAGGRREQVAWARAQARPWLAGAGLALLGAAAIAAGAAGWAVTQAIPLLRQLPETVQALLAADLAALAMVALAAVLLGRAVVAYEVFLERPLPRQGFFRRWRSVVLTSAGAAALVTALETLPVRELYSLSALALLGMTAYALFTAQSYRAHERFVARLLPFVARMGLAERMLRPDPGRSFAEQAAGLLRALCEEAPGAPWAELTLEGQPARRFTYPASASAPDADPDGTLRLALAAAPETRGLLRLGPRPDGRPYAAEEVELARACGERLLDAVAAEGVAQLLIGVLRRRLAEAQVFGARRARVLHDEVLPALHLALLEVADRPEAAAALSRAHRTLSNLMEGEPLSAARQLEALGLFGALRQAIETDFAEAFTAVEWEIAPQAAQRLGPGAADLAAEVLYFAALEAVRNAARHARGPAPAPAPRLRVEAAWGEGFVLRIVDDGLGLPPEADRTAGRGLLLHSTLLAVIGGELRLEPGPGGRGTAVRLRAPAGAFGAAPDLPGEARAGVSFG